MPVLPPNPEKPSPGVNPGGSGNSGYSAGNLIASALRLIGILEAGEQVPPQDGADALIALNHMIDAWNSEGLTVYGINRQTFNFTPGKDAYTLGPGGDWDTVRPSQIERMGLLSLSNPLQPVEYEIEMLSYDQWANIQVKNIQGTLPYHCWDDGSYPLRRITFYFIPASTNQVAIYGWQPLVLFNTLADSVIFPPGYGEAMRYQLAARLAPEWGVELSPAVAEIAIISLARIQRLNARPILLEPDAAVKLVTADGLYVSRDKFIAGY